MPCRCFPARSVPLPWLGSALQCLRVPDRFTAAARRPARCFSAANHLRAFPKHISSGLCPCIGSYINAFPSQTQLLLALPPHSDAFPQPFSCEHRPRGRMPCFAIPWRRGAFLTQRLRISTPRTSLPWHCLPALCLRIVLCALPQLVEAPLRFSPGDAWPPRSISVRVSDMPRPCSRCFALTCSALPLRR